MRTVSIKEVPFTMQGPIDDLEHLANDFDKNTDDYLNIKIAAAYLKLIKDIKFDRLEQICQAEEKGRVVMLPCKVGDIVYIIHTLRSGKKILVETITDAFMLAICVLENRIDKTVFLTKAQAEAALEGKQMDKAQNFVSELTNLINRYSLENESNTPDFILAQYLKQCLGTYERAIKARDEWFSIDPWKGKLVISEPKDTEMEGK